jgi:uncharacterized protein
MRRLRSGEPLVFALATIVALVHALDDAFVHRGPGLGLGQHAFAGLLALASGIGGVVAFSSLRPGARAALAFSFGSLAVVNSALHAGHINADGPAAADLTGVLAGVAGVVLIGLAASIPWRHRGERAVSSRARWVTRGLAVPLALIAALFVLMPIGMGIVATHKWREPVGSPPSAAYQDVTFKASDGLKLAGWYRPSENGAAVLVVHGGSSDRKGSVAHAKMLARHGYGVLLYDARGRGQSDGSENNYGWDWAKDIAGALAFLRGRQDVDPNRIGALGLSTGADVLIEVAAQREDLAALVTDGAAAGSFEDGQRLSGTGIETVPAWLAFTTIRVLSGDAPGPPLEDLITRVESPTLLISAGTTVERDFNLLYAKAARGRVEHWNLPDADHTRAIRQHPKLYEQRVVSFLDAALS